VGTIMSRQTVDVSVKVLLSVPLRLRDCNSVRSDWDALDPTMNAHHS
jgi:hypothetical protein